MNNFAKALVLFVIVFHGSIFVAEALLWMRPGVYEFVLSRLAIKTSLDLPGQALVLQAFFVNQGFYNLLLAIAGVCGLTFLGRGNAPVGYTLIIYMCLSAIGAGVVLGTSTPATIGAILQAVPAVLALAAILPRLLGGTSPLAPSSRGT
jgi:putative membrane protein